MLLLRFTNYGKQIHFLDLNQEAISAIKQYMSNN